MTPKKKKSIQAKKTNTTKKAGQDDTCPIDKKCTKTCSKKKKVDDTISSTESKNTKGFFASILSFFSRG